MVMSFEERLVSGAPREIYKLPGSLLEFHDIVMDATRAEPAGIHLLFELYGGAYYRHTPNADMIVDDNHPWSAVLLEHNHVEKHCHSAASVVLRIDDAVLENAVCHCGTGDDAPILYESFRFPDRAGSAFSPGSRDALPFADFQREDRAYLYLGSLGSFNYGHWLVDDLPRAKAWLELRHRLGITCILVLPAYGGRIDEIRLQSLRLLIDPSIEVQFIAPDRPCRLRDLYYATPVSYHPRTKNPAAIDFVRSRAAVRIPASESQATRKLFVARRPPNSRAIVNFDELWGFLAGLGFEMVEPEVLDFAGQVTLFRDAKIVVGQMGAGMTNSLFCRPATSLIYLAPIGWPEPFYLDLAALGGQQYNILAGPGEGDGPPYTSDFTVPVEPLYHRLAYMGFAAPPHL